ncbi:class I SAM-dependent methyltransferase [Chloroflexota bacterium]
MPGQLDTLEEELARIRNVGVSPVTRLLWKHGSEFITDWVRSICQGNSRVLDVGCGTAGYLVSLTSDTTSECCGMDPLIEVSLKPAKDNVDEKGLAVHLICATGEFIPFRDETFDVVLVFSTLQHVANQDKVLLEIRRVLKPEGRLLLSVPQRKGINSARLLAARMLQRIRACESFFTMDFSSGDLIRILNKNGFQMVKMHGRNFSPMFFPGFLSILLKLHQDSAVMKLMEFSDVLADRTPFLASNLVALCAKEKDG